MAFRLKQPDGIRTVRCSDLPRYFRCHATQLGGVEMSSDSDATQFGKEFHTLIARAISHPGTTSPSSPRVSKAIASAMKFISSLGTHTCTATEKQLEMTLTVGGKDQALLTGTIDAVIVSAGNPNSSNPYSKRMIIVDWKTGQSLGNYSQQMMGLASLIFRKIPDCESITAYVVFVEQDRISPMIIDRADSDEWVRNLSHNVLPSVSHNIGDHCTYCSRVFACDGIRSVLESSHKLFFGDDSDGVSHNLASLVKLSKNPKTEEAAGALAKQLRFRMSVAQKVAEKAKEVIDIVVSGARNGVLPCGDGTALASTVVNRDVIVDHGKVIAKCRSNLSQDQVDDICQASIGQLKLHLDKHLIDQMRAENLIVTKPYTTVRERMFKREPYDDECENTDLHEGSTASAEIQNSDV